MSPGLHWLQKLKQGTPSPKETLRTSEDRCVTKASIGAKENLKLHEDCLSKKPKRTEGIGHTSGLIMQSVTGPCSSPLWYPGGPWGALMMTWWNTHSGWRALWTRTLRDSTPGTKYLISAACGTKRRQPTVMPCLQASWLLSRPEAKGFVTLLLCSS